MVEHKRDYDESTFIIQRNTFIALVVGSFINGALVIYTWSLSVSTADLAVSTAALSASTADLRDSAKQQMEFMKTNTTQIEESIAAANRQADAAFESNKIARDANQTALNALGIAKSALRNSVLQGQAYVTVSAIDVSDFAEKSMHAVVTIKNTGATPASGVFIQGASEVIQVKNHVGQLGYNPIGSACVESETTFKSILSHGEEKTFNIDLFDPTARKKTNLISDDDLNVFKSQDGIFIVLGNICYSDVFGDNISSSFCRQFKVKNGDQAMLCGGDFEKLK